MSIRVHETNLTFDEAGIARMKVDLEINLPAIASFDHMNRMDSLSEHLSTALSPLFDELRNKREEIVKGLEADANTQRPQDERTPTDRQ
jgi:hypothetical protein